MDTVKIGILGTGAISHVYLTTLTTVFQNTEVVGVFDLVPERMEQRKQEFNIKKSYHSMDEMLSDPEIEIVVNLTRLDMHYETTKAILMAGKHVYSEKPLASTFSQGQELMRLAKEKGLMLGGAPDTFLGAGFQTARKVIEDGWIGKIVGASAKFLHSGQENWHPAPDFYYMPGGGNMLDMGSYYLTVLVNLMGPVEEVTGMSCKGKETRTLQMMIQHKHSRALEQLLLLMIRTMMTIGGWKYMERKVLFSYLTRTPLVRI